MYFRRQKMKKTKTFKILTTLFATIGLVSLHSSAIVKADENFKIEYSATQIRDFVVIDTKMNNFNNGDFILTTFDNAPSPDPNFKLDPSDKELFDFFGFRSFYEMRAEMDKINRFNGAIVNDKKILSFAHNHTADTKERFLFASLNKKKMQGDEVKVTVYKGTSSKQVLETTTLSGGFPVPEFNKEVIPVDYKGNFDAVAGLEKAEFTIKPGETKTLTKADFSKPGEEKKVSDEQKQTEVTEKAPESAGDKQENSTQQESSSNKGFVLIGGGLALVAVLGGITAYLKKKQQ